MNFKTKNAKNLVSKDSALSKQAAFDIINTCDIETFETLCENSEHIFDFIIEKIITNLLDATNRDNIKNTYEFAKFYDSRIGGYINACWLKYADEELTDDILEIFEKGTSEQKIYAANYFEKVNDPLALELLNKYAFCKNSELSCACACALSAFGDETARRTAFDKLQSGDDFSKFSALEFLINFGAHKDLKTIINEISTSPLGANIAQELLYKYGFEELYNMLNEEDLLAVYDEIISAYPEDITLETVYDFNICDFCQNIINSQNSYAQRILADLKLTMQLVNADNIYTFDIGKNALAAIKKLNSILQGKNFDTKIIANELFSTQKRAFRAINTLINTGAQKEKDKMEELYNTSKNPAILCECARASKLLGLNFDIQTGLSRITDTNALELFKSYF